MKYDEKHDPDGTKLISDLELMVQEIGLWGVVAIMQSFACDKMNEGDEREAVPNWNVVAKHLGNVIDRLWCKNPAVLKMLLAREKGRK
jgi:hypothetical protein